jgi:hypothetical protein
MRPPPSRPRSASGEPRLSLRVEKVVGYPPLSEISQDQRRELQDALLDADAFEDLPGSGRRDPYGEQNRPKLRLVSRD